LEDNETDRFVKIIAQNEDILADGFYNALYILALTEKSSEFKSLIQKMRENVADVKRGVSSTQSEKCISNIPSYKSVLGDTEEFQFTFFSPTESECLFVVLHKYRTTDYTVSYYSETGYDKWRIYKSSTQQIFKEYTTGYGYNYRSMDSDERYEKGNDGKKEFIKQILILSGGRADLTKDLDLYYSS